MRRRRKIDDELCIYCGDIAAEWDHVPPKKWLRLFALHNTYLTINHVKVAACKDCNSALGGQPLFTIQERRAYIRARLWRKFARLLAMPGWKDGELEELGPSLRRHIAAKLQQKAHVIRRIGMARW